MLKTTFTYLIDHGEVELEPLSSSAFGIGTYFAGYQKKKKTQKKPQKHQPYQPTQETFNYNLLCLQNMTGQWVHRTYGSNQVMSDLS